MGVSLEILMVTSRVKNIPLLANLAGIKSGNYKPWLTCCAGTMPGCYGITDEGAWGVTKEGWSWVSHIKVRFSSEMVSKTKRMSLPVKRGWRNICFCALASYLWCTNSPVKNNWKGYITNQTVDQAETETAVWKDWELPRQPGLERTLSLQGRNREVSDILHYFPP